MAFHCFWIFDVYGGYNIDGSMSVENGVAAYADVRSVARASGATTSRSGGCWRADFSALFSRKKNIRKKFVYPTNIKLDFRLFRDFQRVPVLVFARDEMCVRC